MHDDVIRERALALLATGASDREVGQALGLPRTTIRDWRRAGPRARCPRCWRRGRAMCFSPSDYAELLGLYLADGHVTLMPRTRRLRLSLDARYPGIVDDAEAVLERCLPAGSIGRVRADHGATVVLQAYSSHFTCVFPQHGPGLKHLRPMRLETWQWEQVREAPWSFLRGCIRSDGCVFVNRTGRYRYLSYEFANRSADLLDAFCATCEGVGVGVEYRRYRERVRIYRRASVALLEAQVGHKA